MTEKNAKSLDLLMGDILSFVKDIADQIDNWAENNQTLIKNKLNAIKNTLKFIKMANKVMIIYKKLGEYITKSLLPKIESFFNESKNFLISNSNSIKNMEKNVLLMTNMVRGIEETIKKIEDSLSNSILKAISEKSRDGYSKALMISLSALIVSLTGLITIITGLLPDLILKKILPLINTVKSYIDSFDLFLGVNTNTEGLSKEGKEKKLKEERSKAIERKIPELVEKSVENILPMISDFLDKVIFPSIWANLFAPFLELFRNMILSSGLLRFITGINEDNVDDVFEPIYKMFESFGISVPERKLIEETEEGKSINDSLLAPIALLLAAFNPMLAFQAALAGGGLFLMEQETGFLSNIGSFFGNIVEKFKDFGERIRGSNIHYNDSQHSKPIPLTFPWFFPSDSGETSSSTSYSNTTNTFNIHSNNTDLIKKVSNDNSQVAYALS